MTAENAWPVHSLRYQKHASMRPRPMTAENVVGVPPAQAPLLASMRPRPMTAENLHRGTIPEPSSTVLQ